MRYLAWDTIVDRSVTLLKPHNDDGDRRRRDDNSPSKVPNVHEDSSVDFLEPQAYCVCIDTPILECSGAGGVFAQDGVV